MVDHRSPLHLAVTADQALVAQAVRTALDGHGMRTTLVPWPGSATAPGAGPTRRLNPTGADAVLVMCDLARTTSLQAARELAAAFAGVPQLVLTEAPRGSLWGAVLEAGATRVLDQSVGTELVLDVLAELAEGRGETPGREREELVELWRQERRGREALVDRMEALTPRQRTVPHTLYAGEGVRSIAAELDVSVATVHSHVKAIRRKLRVGSQLAAVAALDELREHGSSPALGLPRQRASTEDRDPAGRPRD